MKFIIFFILLLLFYLPNYMEAIFEQLCSAVKYKGDVIDDKNGGEILFEYSFEMMIIFDDSVAPNYNQNFVDVLNFNITALQQSSSSNLKFKRISYTEKYQSCNSMIEIKKSSDNLTLPNQEIKFILTFIEENEVEDISSGGNVDYDDLCQSNITYFVDTISVFINDITIFNAETGQFFEKNVFTKDLDGPIEQKFLNGSKSVECTKTAILDVPEKVEEFCIDYEGNVTVKNYINNNDENIVGQIFYSIDSESMNFTLDSLEDWYIYILPYCVKNSTECLIILPNNEDFQYPIQLITSFGSFIIGYVIRRNQIFVKYNYSPNLMRKNFYGVDIFTTKYPCWNRTFLYPKFNGTIESCICCTTFVPITTTTPASTTPTKTTSISQTTITQYSHNSSSTNIFSTMSTLNADKPSTKTTTILVISGSIVTGLLIILLIILYFYRKKQQQKRRIAVERMNPQSSIFQNLKPNNLLLLPKISSQTLPASNLDEIEVNWNKLIFNRSILGSGAYGHIMQGKLIKGITKNGIYDDDIIDVAIKMPQKTASDAICIAFRDEIELVRFFLFSKMHERFGSPTATSPLPMKKINGNKNIVQMIGYVTKGPRMCLILEYCCHKDLLSYCKQIKNEDQNFDEIKKETEKEFFIFTWQISHGMQFLASKNIIHCDLAARNILIDENKNAKISDFGLSIHLKSDSIIVNDDTRKLPIKWLSIETLKFQEFSFYSDIWSFGVLLFEMYSFGSAPYAEIPDDPNDLLQHLEDGNRLQKPTFCLDEMYNLMMKCWNSIPTLRPSINELIQTFTQFLEESTKGYGYIKVIKE